MLNSEKQFVVSILNDFKEYLVKNDALVGDKIGEEKLEEFLRSKNIEIQEPELPEEKSEIEKANNLNSEI